ncbi:hypothetical protein KFZ76_23040 [Methylovulum psychrotolerans]|uniref:hypothetical protein n=1 Tax=Methylovulum psychrotolerans TaxID=1704499 RepID=UPI001BFF7F88|nr:hypothetical protein [Methylovulum psychrotolerans]MBT9100580.1 hypothetical protein [Methylovulum psychrotolerans]
MAKAVALTSDELNPSLKPPKAAMRQRGEVPSSELIPLQFRMPPEFVKAFKQAALDKDMKLNELLKECFDAHQKIMK